MLSCASRSPAPTSPASSDSSFSHEGSFHSDPDPPRRGDPAWIARPRNPFIIFRCEYSQKNSREGKRVRRPPGSQPVEKTLSKRAAEAWHQLPPEEKNWFKELAEQEKEEHSRLYPNYRFKPMKRRAAAGAPAKKHSRSVEGSGGYYMPEESFGTLVPGHFPTQTYSWPDPNTSGMTPHCTASPSSLSGWNGESPNPAMVPVAPISSAWDPINSSAFADQSPMSFTEYPPTAGAVDERELSAALAYYVDNGPWLSETFGYESTSGMPAIASELSYSSQGMSTSDPLAIVENNEETFFATLDINDYFNTYQ